MATVLPAALSAREAEVLSALGDHLTNAEIGLRLHISVRTVESHVSSLLRKLGAADRRELAAMAAQAATATVTAPGVAGLPSSWTTFVGREAELAGLADALATDRLVTLLGPGGMGKTRLAAVAAAEAAPTFSGGGAFVDLVPVTPELVVQAVAAALDVVERPQEPLERLVHERVRVGRTLLVLDNCEHVLGPVAAFVVGVLAACPTAVVLATSRERLGVAGERVLPIPALGLTGRADSGDTGEAEQLFLDRAASAAAGDADPALVAEICRRLEGMPLAIELAAARSGSLGIDGLLAGLDDHLRLLGTSSGSAGRHASLRAVMDWSHALLDDDERRLFHRLAVFTDAFDLDAATVVAADGDAALASDAVGRLADKSLLVHRRDETGSRWRMLETVHAYAREQLEAGGEVATIADRHLEWAAARAVALEAAIDDSAARQLAVDSVVDDLRTALSTATSLGPGAVQHALARALGHLLYGARGFLVEARTTFDAAIALAPTEEEAVSAMRVAVGAAHAVMQGDRAFALLVAASARAEAAGDRSAAAITLADAAAFVGRAPGTIEQAHAPAELDAMIEHARHLAPGDLEATAHVTSAEAWTSSPGTAVADAALAAHALDLARQIDDPVRISDALDAVAAAHAADGRLRDSHRSTMERLTLLDRLARHDPLVGGERSDLFHMTSESPVAVGDLVAAVEGARRYASDRSQAPAHFAAAHLVVPFALMGGFDEALAQAAEMVDGWERIGSPTAGWMTPSFLGAALVDGLRAEDTSEARWLELAERVRRQSRAAMHSFSVFVLPRIAVHRGDVDGAVRASRDHDAADGGLYHSYAEAMRIEVAAMSRAADADERLDHPSRLVTENDFASAVVTRARGRYREDEAELLAAADQFAVIGARFERACTLCLVPSRTAEGERELAALQCAPPAAVG